MATPLLVKNCRWGKAAGARAEPRAPNRPREEAPGHGRGRGVPSVRAAPVPHFPAGLSLPQTPRRAPRAMDYEHNKAQLLELQRTAGTGNDCCADCGDPGKAKETPRAAPLGPGPAPGGQRP